VTDNINARAFAQRWQGLYNTAVDRMAAECYAENCEVCAMGAGTFRGREALAKVEQVVLAAAPTRWMRLDAVQASSNVIVAEATLFETPEGGAWQVPFCAVLTLEDGLIVSDHTYADWSKWPGL